MSNIDLLEAIASVIHDERRSEVRQIIFDSVNIERCIRNRYKLKDTEYKNLSEDYKEELRVGARRILNIIDNK